MGNAGQLNQKVNVLRNAMFEELEVMHGQYFDRLQDANVGEPGGCTEQELLELIVDAPTPAVQGYLHGVYYLRAAHEAMTGRKWTI